MHAASKTRTRIHLLHDESAQMIHWISHLLHDKYFWCILAIVAGLTVLSALLILFGKQVPIEEYRIPIRYGFL